MQRSKTMSMLKAFMLISKSSSHSFTKAAIDDGNDKVVLMLQKSACTQASMGRKQVFKYITKSAALCNQLDSHFVTQASKGLFALSLKSVERSLLPAQNDQE